MESVQAVLVGGVVLFVGLLLFWAITLIVVHAWLGRRWPNPQTMSDRDRRGNQLGWLKRGKRAA